MTAEGSRILREEAERVLRTAEYWHYRFDFPWGATVPTRPGWAERVELRRKHFFLPLVERFGGSLKGLTVLDLGCCQGYWSIEAARAGALNIVGMDSSEAFVSEARAAARVLGVPGCTFIQAQLEENAWWVDVTRPDVTLILGLLYHLTDPVYVLRRAMRITAKTLVIDGEVTLDKDPTILLKPRTTGEPTTIRSNVTSNLRAVPSTVALLALLKDGGFEKVEVLPPAREMPADYHAKTTVSIIASRS